MSVAIWNCHTWPLVVSSSVKLSGLRTQCQHWGDISHSLSGYLIWKSELTCDPGHFIWQGMEGYIWQLIWVLHLKIWTHISSWLLHLTSYVGYIWPSWALHLKSWPAKMSCKNNITYYTWQIWALIVEISVIISLTMWYCPCWPLDVSINVEMPSLTIRCQ